MLGLAQALAVCPAAGRGGGDRRGPAAWGWRGRACRDAGRGVRVHGGRGLSGDEAACCSWRRAAGRGSLGARGSRGQNRGLLPGPSATQLGLRDSVRGTVWARAWGRGGARPARGALSGSAAPPRRGVRDLAEVLGIACSRGSPGAAGPRTWPARGARLAHSRALPTPPLHLSVTSAAPNKRAGGGTAYTPLRW